jgi:hypothetical protein
MVVPLIQIRYVRAEIHLLGINVQSLPVSVIALMMEAVSTSETPVSFCKITRRNIPENSPL